MGEIEGIKCIRSVRQVEAKDTAISFVSPPAVTKKVYEEARDHGIKWMWYQPGSEDEGVEGIFDCVLKNGDKYLRQSRL
jgi:predicted CoA-binding protein